MARIQVAVTKKQTHRLNALVLLGVLLAFASVVHAERTDIPEERNFGMALPGEKCRVPPPSRWTEPEKSAWVQTPEWTEPEEWAWIQICEGRIANFNERLNEKLDPRDPDHDDRWSDNRRLSSRFLETILMHEPFPSAIPRRGVRIIGAYFSNAIDLTDALIKRPLLLYQSRFNSQVYMPRLRTPTFISLEGSKFNNDLNMSSISTGGSLFMGNTEFNKADLRAAEIGDQLSMNGSTFKDKLIMDSASVGSSLLMRQANFREVDLRTAKIGDQLSMNESTFKDKLIMDSVSVGGNLFMRNAEFGEVNLGTAEIGNQLEMVESTFKGKLIMSSISVNGNLFMRNAEFGEVELSGAKISDQLGLVESTFEGELNMDATSVGVNLFMRQANFREVNLKGAEISDYLDMDGSTFEDKLDMDATSVGVNLFMRKANFREVNLRAAKIGDQLEMDGSTFKGELDMDAISVGVNLFMRKAAFGKVDLRGAKIGEQLNMNESTFKDKLTMDSVSVGSSLLMRQANFREVDLRTAKVGEQLNMNESTFKDKLIMDSVSVDGPLFLRQVKFNSTANLMFLSVGSSLDTLGSTLRSLDLTGSRIKGELRIGSSNANIEWRGQKDKNGNYQAPKLTLRNARVGTLQDTKDTWPDHLEREFEGFTYDHLGGFGASEHDGPDERGSSWFIEWLAKDESYSPQPYRHLAGVLRTTGHEDMANDILFASRDLELGETDWWPPKWVWLWILKLVIGYGYGWGYFRALVWSAVLVVFGTGLLYWKKEEDKDGIKLGFWYSLDMLLPIIQLREQRYTVDLDNKCARYYFYVHKILGYALISFVFAGLLGLVE